MHRYVDDWVVEITDVTDLAHEIQGLIQAGYTQEAEARLPQEVVYPAPVMPHLLLEQSAS